MKMENGVAKLKSLEEAQRTELTLKKIAEVIQKTEWVKLSGG